MTRIGMFRVARAAFALAVLGLGWAPAIQAQDSLTVRFRYLPAAGVVRAFVPGTFNNWGPNSSGRIAAGAPSAMTYVDTLAQWVYAVRLPVGSTHMYKIHVHRNEAGTTYDWITDPLNPRTNPQDNNNSVVTVADPMLFQPAHEAAAGGNVRAISAGLFGTRPFTSITLTVNGQTIDGLPYYNPATGLLRYAPAAPITSGLAYRIDATDDLGRSVSYETFVPVNVAVTKAPRPAGLADGITYDPNDPSRVTLSLFAPRKKFVYVLGDFNDWKIDPDHLMQLDSLKADSMWFWITFDGLTPGTEYAFQYLVDGEIRIADPYAEKVLHPSDDAYLSPSTYPDLKPYPAGKTDHYVSVLQPGLEEYAWQTTGYVRPAQKDLVIYELHVRDFLAAHDFETLADTLDYLQRLGVNAIELMPVTEFDGNLSWGYNPAFYFTPDKYYGPADDLKRLVDEAHRRGMAVILDVVYNHLTGASPFIRLYNEGEYGAPTADNPWANTVARHPFSVFNDLNHESRAMQYLLDRANAYWLTEYRVDGFRYDLSKGFTQVNSGSDVGRWGNYDASRVRLIQRMADRVWAVDPTAYIILEHFAANSEEKVLAEYRVAEGRPGMMLWGNLNAAYNEATMGYADARSNFSGVYYGNRGWSVPNLVGYMESHDEERLMYRNLTYGACANYPAGGNGCATNLGEYSVRRLDTALDRMKLAGAFFFTLPGPKMIWQFGELGYEVNIDFNGRTGEKPIRWNYAADPARQKLYKTWQALLKLRRENPVFTSPETVVSMNTASAVKTLRLSHPTMDAFVVGNFDVLPRTVAPGFPKTGTWYDYFTGAPVEVTDLAATQTLLPGEFHVYTTVAQETPEAGLITVDVEDGDVAELPERASLSQNYPNPFNPSTVITFALAQAGPVRLEVFDVTGRRVALLADGLYPAGEHALRFDARMLPSGTYLYRLQAGGRLQTRKMLLVR